MLLVREADLDRVENLIQCVVDSDDLHVLKGSDTVSHIEVAPERVEKGSVAVGRQFYGVLGIHHDFAFSVDGGKH